MTGVQTCALPIYVDRIEILGISGVQDPAMDLLIALGKRTHAGQLLPIDNGKLTATGAGKVRDGRLEQTTAPTEILAYTQVIECRNRQHGDTSPAPLECLRKGVARRAHRTSAFRYSRPAVGIREDDPVLDAGPDQPYQPGG